ncbi:MAG: 5-formyltetrahydrofolate cyclo-ligase [Bacteroidetes bacterium]|nr:5-formyltetrahydrofolate cyclo-ligase [Bacteroidota bacterium]
MVGFSIKRFFEKNFSFFQKQQRIKDKKYQIRADIRAKKRQLSEAEKNEAAKVVFERIETMSAFQKAKVVFLYWSTTSELPTHEYIRKWSEKKIILLPSVSGERMHLRRYVSSKEMHKGEMNMMEPTTDIYKGHFDLAIIPGIAFDRERNRMGRGKGYYDRFLRSKNVPVYGVGFDFQVLRKIPTTKKDMKVTCVFSPGKTIE